MMAVTKSSHTNGDVEDSCSGFLQALKLMTPSMPVRKSRLRHRATMIPKTSVERRERSCCDEPIDTTQLTELSFSSDDATVLYLGYGSNLAAETFLGKRGIKPLSQINIVAPSISLSFDLPGLPYSEPCFANTRPRSIKEDIPEDEPPYHKNAWKKGLVGVVYEVTKKDYAHIIATEGGGSGYHDVLVDCYVLDDDPKVDVPWTPKGKPFKAHTLYAHAAQPLRPDPDYAQPSPRYLKLITDGAAEHDLPTEYRNFLVNIRTYRTTTAAQRLGSFIFLSVWGPVFMFVFAGAARVFLRDDGTYPEWFQNFTNAIFAATWASYDGFFYKTFGDGERTIGKGEDDEERQGEKVLRTGHEHVLSEKTPLLVEAGTRVAHQV